MNLEEIVTKKDLLEMEKRILAALLGKPQQDDGCISMEDAVKYIGAKSKSALYKLTSSGKIAYHKVGKMNTFKKADLDKYLAHHRKSSNDEISAAAALREIR